MTKRACLLTAGLLLGLVACRERNPAYMQKVGPDAAGGPKDTPAADAAADAVPADTFVPVADVPGDDTSVVADVAPPDQPVVVDVGILADDGGVDTGGALDTRDTRKPGDDVADVAQDKPGTGDAWDVPVLPDVVDAASADARDVPVLDANVDGMEPDTAVVDAAPLCQEGQVRSCSSPGNPLVGLCKAGTQKCKSGAWTACSGETLPANSESCNGADDNCNGMTDEGCATECVVVAPSGNDTDADGTVEKPFATVQAGIAFAAQGDGGAPMRVCVAGGSKCADAFTYTMDASLVIGNGARVQGNYALSGSELSYCAETQPPTTKLEFTVTGTRVLFGDGVALPTEFSGFAIKRFSSPTSVGTVEPTYAVQVDGGKNIVLSRIFVTDAPAGDATYGVDVESGGQVTIIGSSISGGGGKTAAIGVYVNGGSVILRNNCDKISKGGCVSSCGEATLGIFGRSATSAADAAADFSAVFVTASSTASSTMVGNALCGGSGTANGAALGANLATLRCIGDGCGTVTGNAIGGGSGPIVIAVAIKGGRATLDGNAIVPGCASEGTIGVLLEGSSARLQNNRVSVGECETGANSASFFGVRVVLASSDGEPDLHSNDIDSMGGTGSCESVGVSFERMQGENVGSGILRNNIISAGNCSKRFAVREDANAAARIIENNDLYPGPDPGGAGAVVLYRRGDADATTADKVNALAGAAKNISANPKFVSYPDDLHLSKDSPCIDNGSAEGAPSTDGDGNARPFGSGYDIGAYERPSS